MKQLIKAVAKKSIVFTSSTSDFTLMRKPEVAPEGPQPGVITEVTKRTGNKKGEVIEQMDVVVQLEKTDRKGQPFKLTKSYILTGSNRGTKLFFEDYYSFSGVQIDLAGRYDFEPKTIVGSKLVAEVEYKESRKGLEAVIVGFLPVTEQAETAEQTEQAEQAEPAAESVAA